MPFWRGAVYWSEWLKFSCILRALNFKFSWGTHWSMPSNPSSNGAGKLSSESTKFQIFLGDHALKTLSYVGAKCKILDPPLLDTFFLTCHGPWLRVVCCFYRGGIANCTSSSFCLYRPHRQKCSATGNQTTTTFNLL